MTLIAAWKVAGVPLLAGDVAISITGRTDLTHVVMPTVDRVEDVLPSDWQRHIVGRRRKTYVISDSLAICWAHSTEGARIVISSLRQSFSGRNPTLRELRDHLSHIPDLTGLRCFLIGWIVDGTPVGFRWDSAAPAELTLGERFVLGPVTEDWRRVISPDGRAGRRDPLRSAISVAGVISLREVWLGDNLPQLFGGGIEIPLGLHLVRQVESRNE